MLFTEFEKKHVQKKSSKFSSKNDKDRESSQI